MSRSEDAARWLDDNPGASTRQAGERHGVTRQAIEHAWYRLFPYIGLNQIDCAAGCR